MHQREGRVKSRKMGQPKGGALVAMLLMADYGPMFILAWDGKEGNIRGQAMAIL